MIPKVLCPECGRKIVSCASNRHLKHHLSAHKRATLFLKKHKIYIIQCLKGRISLSVISKELSVSTSYLMKILRLGKIDWKASHRCPYCKKVFYNFSLRVFNRHIHKCGQKTEFLKEHKEYITQRFKQTRPYAMDIAKELSISTDFLRKVMHFGKINPITLRHTRVCENCGREFIHERNRKSCSKRCLGEYQSRIHKGKGLDSNKKHEIKIQYHMNHLEEEGFRCIMIHPYSPDIIAIKDGEVTAYEIGSVNIEKYKHISKYYDKVIHIKDGISKQIK